MSLGTKVQSRRVAEFIAWSRNAAPAWLKEYGVAETPDAVQTSYAAWQLLQKQVRRDARHRYDNDYDAAAAEHYMYIRYLAGASGDPYCYVAPTAYALKKVFDQLLGRLQDGRTDESHPVLPADAGVVAWGQRGVSDGLEDYKNTHPGQCLQRGAAIESLAGFAFSADNARKMGEYAQHPIEFVGNQIKEAVR